MVVVVVDDVIVVVEGVCNDLGFKRAVNPVFLHCSGGIVVLVVLCGKVVVVDVVDVVVVLCDVLGMSFTL